MDHISDYKAELARALEGRSVWQAHCAKIEELLYEAMSCCSEDEKELLQAKYARAGEVCRDLICRVQIKSREELAKQYDTCAQGGDPYGK